MLSAIWRLDILRGSASSLRESPQPIYWPIKYISIKVLFQCHVLLQSLGEPLLKSISESHMVDFMASAFFI